MNHLQPNSCSNWDSVQTQLCTFTWAVVLLAPGTVFLPSGHAGFKQELKLSLCQGSMTQKSSDLWGFLIKSEEFPPRPPPQSCFNLHSAACKEQDLSPRASQLSSGGLTARFLSKGHCSPLLCIHQLSSNLTQQKWGLGGCFGVRAGYITHTRLRVEVISPRCHETRNPKQPGVS